MGPHVDKQDVVFETGLFSIFHGHEKQLCFQLCVCGTFHQGYDLQTICVKSSSQRSRCWDRMRSVMALLGKEVYHL